MTAKLLLAIALAVMTASGMAAAEPCQSDSAAVREAVTEVAKALDEHGLDYVRQTILKTENGKVCGLEFVSILDHSGTWVFSPAAPDYVGKNIKSLGDGAAINFLNGLIQGAIERKGALLSYFTKDRERGVTVDKSLYWIDVPSRKLVVYGAFAAR